MNKDRLNFFRNRLLKEREDVLEFLKQMEGNETFNSDEEFSSELSELSIYDNHPSDVATELYDAEKGRALKEHEISLIGKIEDSLRNVENGTYGKCKMCGREISEERLEFIPYAEFCVSCQEKNANLKPREKNNRAIEEDVLGKPFGYGFNDFDETYNQVGYDAEDSYQDVQSNEWRENVDYEYMDDDQDFVEPIEKVSNDQYKSQLPD
ncbi:TraR/DksA C4-type zinc finger protein [Candidatus Clostridium radicumherbarum]|uniref:TraR/DksA C4-type zinc finger protein n=1 Tax=Candidatus Clostridium radicumherbarum TaxID=3381662 RepID=A0ABW8TV47_9CLOT